MEDQLLSQAVIVFLGKGRSAFPRSDEQAVVLLAESAHAEGLVGRVRTVISDLMAVEVDWSTHTLSEGGDEAERVMRASHPELTADALAALRWMFTYNWR
ncbi:MAG: hypothetical protein JST33_01450 [Actinobacteria bacterium]|nr:hypothetical protein [Actinomycetota bacterium]